jgi:hypothetical protein
LAVQAKQLIWGPPAVVEEEPLVPVVEEVTPAAVVLGTPLVLAWPVVVPVVAVVDAPVPVLDPPVVEEPAVVVPSVLVELPVVTPVVVLDGVQTVVPLQLQPQVLQSGQLAFTPLFTPGASPGHEQDPPWTQTTQPEQLGGAVPQLPDTMSQH